MFKLATRTRALYSVKSVPTFTRPLLNLYRFNSSLNTINLESSVAKYSEGPLVIKYTSEHEWLAAHPDGTAFVGITKYAADALGDATYIELPEVGAFIEEGESFGSVESVKSASEVYAPVNCEVIAINEQLEENPNLVNEDPIGEGWFIQVKLANAEELSSERLLDEAAYNDSLEEDH